MNVAYKTATAHGADGALFADHINRRFVSGFPSTEGVVLCHKNGVALFLDMRYAVSAENAGLDKSVTVIRCVGGIMEAVKAFVTENAIGKLIIESTAVTIEELERFRAALEGVEFVPVKNICGKARQIKTAGEIACIRKAQSITDKCFSHILGFIKRGVTEKEVAAEMEYFMKKNGADGLAFETIAVSGKKSALPHGVPGEDVLTENAFFTMDFGASYGGYCSDMTRTIVLGKASDEMRRIYNTVLSAQNAAIAAIKDGVPCKDVDAAARNIIATAGYGDYFNHSTGHSLGLEIHESPACSPKSGDVLQAGMFMTVEPGIYIENLGGVRIEDMVLVTEGGCEDFTASPKELIEI